MTRIRYLSIAAAAALCAAAVAALAHEGHNHATGMVKDRMEAMTKMAERVKAITQRVRANKDLTAIAGDAHVLHELAGKIASQFPAGSTQHPTAAKEAIWKTWPDFESKAKALESASEKLMNTNPGDKKAIGAQFRAVSQACSDCHEKYRTTK